MTIAIVGVVGAGLMGRGIAQAVAQAGHRVLLHDSNGAQWNSARGAIEASLAKFVEKGTLSAEDRVTTLERIAFVPALEELAACDLVVEAIVESLDAKRALWAALERACPAQTRFASNTSSLSITDQAAGLANPGRLCGLHFFNPVPLMPLVEVVRGLETAPTLMDEMLAFVAGLGKTAIATRDESGFVVNLLLVPYLLDAVRALERGVGDVASIDAAMRLGAGHPMGPFTLLDFVGLDTVVRIGDIMFEQYRETRYAPPPLLRRMVTAGRLGKKNGRGFYDWRGSSPVPLELGL